mmetsp:Transcript_40370/g.94855  ORF Transcript_40370/g.94855 Transcript_40370/m.94855 type:complete len:102 (-) Transcript_40370:418-723(-)
MVNNLVATMYSILNQFIKVDKHSTIVKRFKEDNIILDNSYKMPIRIGNNMCGSINLFTISGSPGNMFIKECLLYYTFFKSVLKRQATKMKEDQEDSSNKKG